MCWGTLPPPATTTPWPKLSEAPRWQYSDLQKPLWELDSCQFLTTNPCTFLHESILRVKMFSTLTISTVGASFLMHLLLHRECILNGPQERLGNSKAFTIILLPVSAPPRLKMDETTWNNYQLVQAFVYRSYLVDFQNKMSTWQLFFFRRSLPPDDTNKTCANWLNKGITSPFWTAKHHGSRLPFALHSPPGLGEQLQLRISHIHRSLMVEAPNRNKTCEHVNKIGGQVLTSSH